jgi:hypothetical protein
MLQQVALPESRSSVVLLAGPNNSTPVRSSLVEGHELGKLAKDLKIDLGGIVTQQFLSTSRDAENSSFRLSSADARYRYTALQAILFANTV